MTRNSVIAAIALSVAAGTLGAPVAASAATMIRSTPVETAQKAETVGYYGYYGYNNYYYYPRYRKNYYYNYNYGYGY